MITAGGHRACSHPSKGRLEVSRMMPSRLGDHFPSKSLLGSVENVVMVVVVGWGCPSLRRNSKTQEAHATKGSYTHHQRASVSKARDDTAML